MNQAAVRLKNNLESYSILAQYQKGYFASIGEPNRLPNETYCNNFARDFLDMRFKRTPKDWGAGFGGLINEYDYDILAIGNDERSLADCILNIDPQEAINNLSKCIARGRVISLDPIQAQARANLGIVVHVVSGEMNHEAIVCPDENEYDEKRGCLIGQAGAVNGIMYMSDNRTFGAYPRWRNGDTLYIQYHEYDD